MRFRRPFQHLFLLLACFSVAASSVSACACVHHVETSSVEIGSSSDCHGNHENKKSSNVQPEIPSGDVVDANCECGNEVEPRAFLTKTDQKQLKVSAKSLAIVSVIRFDTAIVLATQPPADFQTPRLSDLKSPPAEISPRAPPRL